ncbi:MAG: membrane protein [Anaerolineales bacterium]|nr:membrane protein [Anaerolineales bacterium]
MSAWLQRAFVFRWNGWTRFLRDFAVIQLGFLLFGIAIDMWVLAGIGTSPWVALEVALTYYLPITLGQSTIVVAIIIILLDLVMGQPLGWGTLANMLFIGLWIDVLMPWLPAPPAVLWLQVPYLLSGVGLMGLATALYVGVMAGAGPRDSLMLAVSRRLGISVRVARTSIEVIVVILCLLLDGTIGLGTLIIALAAGPAVQLGFRLLRVQTFKPGVVEAPSSDLV